MRLANVDLDRVIHYIASGVLPRRRACIHTLHALLFLMCPQGRKRHWWCKPSVRVLARMVGRSRQQVHTHLAQLERAGLISVRNRYSNGYRLSNLYVPGPRLCAIVQFLSEKEKSDGLS